MSCHAGPDIVENGLVFCYDMSNTQKSWKGKPTINLKSNPNFATGATGYSAYVGSTPTIVSVTDFPSMNGLPKNVLQCISASAPGGGGNPGGMSFENPSLTTGLSYTISFWAKSISSASLNTYYSNQNGSGDQSNFSFSQTIDNQWKFYSYTVSSLDLMKNVWFVYTGTVNAVWQYADFQIEQNTFATPFIAGTRSNTQAILDLTNNNTITANSLTYNSDGTFSFNGSNLITTSSSSNFLFINDFAVSGWMKRNGATGTLWALGYYYNGILFRPWTSDDLYINGTNYGNITQYIPNNSWTYFVLTRIGTQVTLYINGSSVWSSVISGTINSNSNALYIGRSSHTTSEYYTGELSVLKVYKNKGLSAAEVAQNFNATRRRYGI